MIANTGSDVTSRFALDTQGLGQLKLQAKTDPAAGVRPAAQQFEALFLGIMLKSMRDTLPKDGMFDNSTTEMYTSMLDSQLAQTLSKGKGIGLAEMLVRQMQTHGMLPPEADAAKTASAAHDPRAAHLNVIANPGRTDVPAHGKVMPEVPVPSDGGRNERRDAEEGFGDRAGFVDAMRPHAADAAQSLGIPDRFLIAQAALESAWGKREIRDAQGNHSHNLFGIKAGRGWTGAVVEATTTEYVHGVARKTTERFRAYASYADGFKDYAALLKNNPRYAPLFSRPLDAEGFARGLQEAGYATDPMYADKLVRVIGGATLRHALA